MTTGHTHNPSDVPPDPGLDPANAQLADALRKSFWALKVLMIVLVLLYFVSGWFSVKPNEVGFVLRFGKLVGSTDDERILKPGWHWSLPYPFDKWHTVSQSERELPVEFIYELTERERLTGELEYKFNNRLSPERDDYLITGDVNIIHGMLVLKYRITDPIAYITHVHPSPDPKADARSKPYRHYAEYTVLTNLARSAVIETAATWEALDIRGSGQKEFLRRVASLVNEKLDELSVGGASLGISLDRETGVLASNSNLKVEAIFPPRQVQKVFDEVFAIQTRKSKTIQAASNTAGELLTQMAGPGYGILAGAIDAEFDALLSLSRAESDGIDSNRIAALRETLAGKRATAEQLLNEASGRTRLIVQQAHIQRDDLIREVATDFNQVHTLLPEFKRNPEILISRLRDEAYAQALSNPAVVKFYVPASDMGVRLLIPRAGNSAGVIDQSTRMRSSTISSLGAAKLGEATPQLEATRFE